MTLKVKVREATSNDPWGPSSTMMSEIADLTYNVVAFSEIMQMVWKRLNDHGKNWRHVYKALVLLEYLIKTGSEKVIKRNSYQKPSSNILLVIIIHNIIVFWNSYSNNRLPSNAKRIYLQYKHWKIFNILMIIRIKA